VQTVVTFLLAGSSGEAPRTCHAIVSGTSQGWTLVAQDSTLTINNDFIGFMGEFTGHPSEAIETHSWNDAESAGSLDTRNEAKRKL
jgi:hypothetical protein